MTQTNPNNDSKDKRWANAQPHLPILKSKGSFSSETTPTVEEIAEQVFPYHYIDYNRGLLPDEPGYDDRVSPADYEVREKREALVAAINQKLKAEYERGRLELAQEIYNADMWSEDWRSLVQVEFDKATTELNKEGGSDGG